MQLRAQLAREHLDRVVERDQILFVVGSCRHRLKMDPPGTGVVSSDGRNTGLIKEAVLPSTRRVKKGPGRRPQSAKRQRFMELRARGWSISAAAREVGVSRTAGNNWVHGYKTYRNGVVVDVVAPLDRLEVREISSRFLSQGERIEIADLARPA